MVSTHRGASTAPSSPPPTSLHPPQPPIQLPRMEPPSQETTILLSGAEITHPPQTTASHTVSLTLAELRQFVFECQWQARVGEVAWQARGLPVGPLTMMAQTPLFGQMPGFAPSPVQGSVPTATRAPTQNLAPGGPPAEDNPRTHSHHQGESRYFSTSTAGTGAVASHHRPMENREAHPRQRVEN